MINFNFSNIFLLNCVCFTCGFCHLTVTTPLSPWITLKFVFAIWASSSLRSNRTHTLKFELVYGPWYQNPYSPFDLNQISEVDLLHQWDIQMENLLHSSNHLFWMKTYMDHGFVFFCYLIYHLGLNHMGHMILIFSFDPTPQNSSDSPRFDAEQSFPSIRYQSLT